jgi:hypothetical protein
MIASGAGVKVVQQQLGHRTATLTLDRYAHLFPDELDASQELSTDSERGLPRILCGPSVAQARSRRFLHDR